MSPGAPVAADPATRAGALAGLGGVVLEVDDLASTRAFYMPILSTSPGTGTGTWREDADSLSFATADQVLRFIRRESPRTFRDSGYHQAYAVPRDLVRPLAHSAAAAGYEVAWWREDHPAEHEVAPYLYDPSGNRVQLQPVDRPSPLLHHVAIEVHDLELAEPFYIQVLGGTVDYYHGWKMDDYAQAKAWERGEDPCAPWTRRFDVRYWDKVRVARPNMQLFVRYGESVVGLILALEHRQEPPPGQVAGTPALVLRSEAAADAWIAWLAAKGVPFERQGSTLALRDPAGNFIMVACASHAP